MWAVADRAGRELRPDVVHIQYQSAAYGLHGAVNFLPWRLRLLRRRPRVVTTFHDLRTHISFRRRGRCAGRPCWPWPTPAMLDVMTNPADWQQLEQARLTAKLRPIPIGSNIACEPPAGL